VRGVLDNVVVLVSLTFFYFADLLSDAFEGINKSVHLNLVFGLGRLYHETTDDREGDSGSVETVIHESLRNICLSHIGSPLKVSHIKDKLVSDSAVFSPVQNFIRRLKLVSHVVCTHDGVLRGSEKTTATHHLDVGIWDGQDTCAAIRSRSDCCCLSSFDWKNRMAWHEGDQMLLNSDGADTWATTTMRNGEGLVEVKMANISTNRTW